MQNLDLVVYIKIQEEILKEKIQVKLIFIKFLINLGTIRAYRESREDHYTLSDLKFFVGDCIDLTIITSIDKQKV